MTKPVNASTPHTPHRSILALLVLGFLIMLWGAVDYFSLHPSLIRNPPQTAQQVPQAAENDNVAKLMQILQENPNDVETLLNLAQHFTHLEEWEKAENFTLRAQMAEPNNATVLHVLGLVQHNQGRNQEAAESLEKSLNAKENPMVRYSLAILHGYFLNNSAVAIEHFKSVQSDPSASEELKENATLEQEKLAKAAQ